MQPAMTLQFVRFVYLWAPLGLLALACGAPGRPPEVALAELREAISTPVSSADEAANRSRIVEGVLDDNALMNLTRAEVEAAIGRGDPCSRHPRCSEQGFESDDWFYTVGAPGDAPSGNLPRLIVGFDHTGRVVRAWNLRTH